MSEIHENEDSSGIEVNVVEDEHVYDSDEQVSSAKPGSNEEELRNISKSVQKRINKLKYDFHEERRRKESATKMQEEAVRYAKNVSDENRQLRELVNRGEQVLIDEVKSRTETDLMAAKKAVEQAHEDGDSSTIADAQELLSKASYDAKKALEYSPVTQSQTSIPDPSVTDSPAQIPAERPPADPKALEWSNRNGWFGKDREMTAFAYAVHESIVGEENIDPRSSQYYARIDSKMRERFPEKFGEVPSVQEESEEVVLRPDGALRKPSTVVAPATRNNGANPRKVQLTKTQVALAKRLGVTPEQYAIQVLALEQANG